MVLAANIQRQKLVLNWCCILELRSCWVTRSPSIDRSRHHSALLNVMPERQDTDFDAPDELIY